MTDKEAKEVADLLEQAEIKLGLPYQGIISTLRGESIVDDTTAEQIKRLYHV